ncbi:MAG: polysulfide reductase NrfD [Chloroflexi bacterium]|nr:polysulfide reductase NrfD [Chloroflexota bacterium]
MNVRAESRPPENALPHGILQFSVGWQVLIVALLVLIGWGAYAYSRQVTEGEVVTGMRDLGAMGGAPWGLYVVFVVYFVGVSFAGIIVAALVRIFNLDYMRPISRIAELLTVVALVLGGFSVLVDVGQPLRALINLPLYARPVSPFFATFTMVISAYLLASVAYLYLASRRDAALMAGYGTPLRRFYRLWAAGYRDTPAERKRREQTSFWLALAILPMLVTAHSTLGFVFGIQTGRPGWHSALQAPDFLMLAGVSGTGLLIIIAAILRVVLDQRQKLNLRVFAWLSNFGAALTLIYLYFMVADYLTLGYAAPSGEETVLHSLLTGRYALFFWLSGGFLVASLVISGLQLITKRYSLALIVFSGVLVNVAAVAKRYLIVIPSQTTGNLLPYEPGSYSPTWVEYGVIAGLFALGALMYVLFVKVFPIMEVPEPR